MGREDHADAHAGDEALQFLFRTGFAGAHQERLEGRSSVDVIQFRIPGILERVDQHDLAFDVLDDSKQQVGLLVRRGKLLILAEFFQNVLRTASCIEPRYARRCQLRNPQSRRTDAVQRQRQEDAAEYLEWPRDERSVILPISRGHAVRR